jgi:hypothetical protein
MCSKQLSRVGENIDPQDTYYSFPVYIMIEMYDDDLFTGLE